MNLLAGGVKQYNKLVFAALGNVVAELCEVVGEGTVVGIVWKSTREAMESMGYESDDGFAGHYAKRGNDALKNDPLKAFCRDSWRDSHGTN